MGKKWGYSKPPSVFRPFSMDPSAPDPEIPDPATFTKSFRNLRPRSESSQRVTRLVMEKFAERQQASERHPCAFRTGFGKKVRCPVMIPVDDEYCSQHPGGHRKMPGP